MGGSRNKKRKERNSSDNDNLTDGNRKLFKQRGPSSDSDNNVSVSDLLNQTNAVLYNVDSNNVFEINSEPENIVFKNMAANSEPTNKDLMNCLQNISSRLGCVEKKLSAIDKLEKRVGEFEKELKSIWLVMEERAKKTEDRVMSLEDKVENADIGSALLASKVDDLSQARDNIQEEVAYLKSQSMRNNLIFTNVPEDFSKENETPEETEQKLRHHLHTSLKIAKDMTDSIRFERVHRSPGHQIQGKVRTIVAKFTFFKDREFVRRQWKNLNGTRFSMYEQFPQEIIAKRRKLVPKMKEARDQGKKAWIAYDTLYIDGRPIRD